MQVGPQQAGLVVEHLLEVGDQPLGVGRVAGEAAAQVVVDATGGHGVEGAGGHGQGRRRPSGRPVGARVAQGQVDQGRLGELGGAAEPAPLGVEPPGQLGRPPASSRSGCRLGAVGRRAARSRAGRVAIDRARGDGLGQLVGLLLDLVAAVVPDVGEGGEHGGERRGARAVVGREVGAAVEGPAVRGQEDAHRPAARTGDGLDRLHVDGVDVGSLLAVDLDAHEGGVEPVGDGRVLERLVGHDVAPVAGRVADGQEDRPVRSRARSKASSPHGYQSTGLSACWRR